MKTMTRLSWILRIVIACIYIQTLYFKFTAHPDSVHVFSELGLEPFGRIGLGLVELVTSILILIPVTMIWGMLLSIGIISGAVVSHLLVLGLQVSGDGGSLFALALVVFAATSILFWIYKSEAKQIFSTLKKADMRIRTCMALATFLGLFFQGCSQGSTKTENKKSSNMEMTDADWKQKLTSDQYYILREKGTERPFTGEFVFTKDKGTYKCAGCGTALFTDDMKFDSHCGWPSFDKEIAGGRIIQTNDHSHGMSRTEITCAKCGGHLGHIFDDGPTETGARYCVNSGALSFEPVANNEQIADNIQTITLAGGCFWCIEAIFEGLKGVEKVESGYSGGSVQNPSYKQVTTGSTGHAEVVSITYDANMISLEELLEVFFTLQDPTTINQQGADVGTQYRSAIFYHTLAQKATSENVISELNEHKVFTNPIVTEVTAFSHFYKAEDYHQEYYELNKEEPYCRMVIKPKMDKLHKVFKDKLKVE